MVSSRYTPPFTVTQQKVLAVLPKVTSIPSLLGSAYIIQHVLRKRNGRIYHRILLVMSAMDFIYAAKCFMSTWVIPSELTIWQARGNTQTCDAWGFMGHGASLSSALYNASLAIYFCLTVAFGWRERALQQRCKFETLAHAIPLVVGWSTAIASLLLELNNPIGWTCWIGTYPPGCGLPAPWSPPCQRASVKQVDIYRWALFHAELWFAFVLCAIAMIIMVMKVRQRENAMARYVFGGDGSDSTRRSSERRVILSQKVTTQASLYIFFFFVTWIFPMVQFVVGNQTGYLLFPFLVLTTLVNPLQGFYDAIIYARPRYLQYREREVTRRRTMHMSNPSRIESLVHILTTTEDGDDIVEGEIMPEEDLSHPSRSWNLTTAETGEDALHRRKHNNTPHVAFAAETLSSPPPAVTEKEHDTGAESHDETTRGTAPPSAELDGGEVRHADTEESTLPERGDGS